MPPLTEYVNNGNVRRFLDMLSAAEGTDTHGYNTLFGGGRFDSLAQHPRVSAPFTETTGRRNRSDASGRYGFLSSTWDEQAKKLGLKDFGPYSQDLAAINLLKEKGILPHVLAGEWDQAIQKAGPVWASLPSSPYPQPRRSREFVMARLNNANATTSAPTAQGPSIEAMMNAMSKAQAANDSNAVLEIQNLIKGRFTSARQKAEAAGDTNAVQEIDSRLQQIMSGQGTQAAPVPVAPPTEPQGTTLAPRVADALVDPQAAPVAPQAAPAAADPALAPAAAPAPAAPQSTAQILGVPGAAPAAPVAPVAPKVTDAQMNQDPKWISNAKQIYKDVQGSEFSGSDAEAADWLKNYVAQTKWNMAGGATTIYDAMNKMSPESKQALLDSIQMYGDAPISLESVGRALKGIGTDPTTYATGGVGALITKTLGKKAAEAAVIAAAKEGLQRQLLSTGTKQAMATGAGFGAASNALEQGVKMAADGQENFDFGNLGIASAIGAAAGGTLNKGVDLITGRNAIRNLGAKSSSPEDLVTNAEIISKIKQEAENPAREIFGKQPNLQRREVNARVTNDIMDEARKVVNGLPKDYPNRDLLVEAAKKGINNSQRTLEELAQVPGGQELVDVINKAVRADRMTAPNPSSQNFFVRGARTLSDLMLPGMISKPINYMLKPRGSSEDVTRKLIDKYGNAAEAIMAQGETPYVSQPIQSLQQIAQDAIAQTQARRAAAQAQSQTATQAGKAENLAARNSILEATGMPLGGSFQELLQGGRSGLNLTSDQAVDALRIVSGKNRGNPLGTAADQIRKSSPEGVTSPDAFYGIQNEIRKLQERGVLGGQPGALTSVNPVRNPISYAANVRTAEAALKQATDAAPSNALAQFANVVAGTKSPETKAKLVQQRLLKTTDPAEIQYLTDFIEPLTRFGAKSK